MYSFDAPTSVVIVGVFDAIDSIITFGNPAEWPVLTNAVAIL